ATGQTQPLPDAVAGGLRQLLPGCRLVGMAARYVDWNPEDNLSRAGRDRAATVVYLVLADAREYCRANEALPTPDPSLGLWRQLAGQPGRAVVSENFARIHGVRPGDAIQLKGRKGPVRLEVVGTMQDYSWIRGTIFVDRQANREALG